MKFLLLFLAVLNVAIISGQTFEFEYSTPDDDKLWDVFEAEDGNFYCVGHVAKPGSNKYKGFIQKIDSNGELIDTRIIDVQHRTCDFHGILQDTAGSIVICGNTSDTTEEQYNAKLLFLRLDYDLQTIDSGTISVVPDRKVWPIVSKNIGFNNEFLFSSGLYREGQGIRSLTLKINQSLDSILLLQEKGGYGYHIRQLTDSTYWTVHTFGYTIIDSMFQGKDYGRIPYDLSQPHGVKWDTDTSFYLLAKRDPGPGFEIGIIKQYDPLDTTGHLYQTWDVYGSWDFPAPNGALDFNNKDSIYAGIISPVGIWAPYSSNYVVLQTDSMLNIRWERFYGEGEYYFELMKVIATEDGGCLLAGTRYDYIAGIKERDIYIVKLNNEGLIVGENENPEIKMQEALVFPNPGKNEMKVRIAAQYPTSTVSLYDVNGRFVLEQDIQGKWGTVNTSFLIPGTYIYRITSGDGLFETGKWLKQ